MDAADTLDRQGILDVPGKWAGMELPERDSLILVEAATDILAVLDRVCKQAETEEPLTDTQLMTLIHVHEGQMVPVDHRLHFLMAGQIVLGRQLVVPKLPIVQRLGGDEGHWGLVTALCIQNSRCMPSLNNGGKHAF